MQIADLRNGRFDVLDAGERAEVIDTATGRPVAILDSRAMAVLEADALNTAADAGPRYLAKALGAIEDHEVEL